MNEVRQIEASFLIRCDADELWRLVADFTRVTWMQGVEKVTEQTFEGKAARALHLGGGLPPVIEYLEALDHERRELQYGVCRHDVMPVSDYSARVRVLPAPEGSVISFTGRFSQAENPGEVSALLSGAYQMMADGMAAALGAVAGEVTAVLPR